MHRTQHTPIFIVSTNTRRGGQWLLAPPPPPRAPPPLRHPSAAPDRGPLPPATLHPIPGFVCHINKPHPGGGGVLWPHVTNEGCARKSSCPSPFRSLSPCRSLHNPGGGEWAGKLPLAARHPFQWGGGFIFPEWLSPHSSATATPRTGFCQPFCHSEGCNSSLFNTPHWFRALRTCLIHIIEI